MIIQCQSSRSICCLHRPIRRVEREYSGNHHPCVFQVLHGGTNPCNTPMTVALFLWRLRIPTICFLQTFQNRQWCNLNHSAKAWEPRELMVYIQVQGRLEKACPHSAGRRKKANPQWVRRRPPKLGRASVLLSSQIQMLISSGNTLTDTPRNNV